MAKVPIFRTLEENLFDLEIIFEETNKNMIYEKYIENREKFIYCFENMNIKHNIYLVRKVLSMGFEEPITILFDRGLDIYDHISGIIFNERNLKILLNHDLDLNKFDNNKPVNSFHRILLSNSYNTIKIALEAGANINCPTKCGYEIFSYDIVPEYSTEIFPIRFYIRREYRFTVQANEPNINIDIIKLLLDNNGNIEHIIPELYNFYNWHIFDEERDINIHYKNHYKLINLFIDYGLDINGYTRDLQRCKTTCVKLILGKDIIYSGSFEYRKEFILQFKDKINFDLEVDGILHWGFSYIDYDFIFNKQDIENFIEMVDVGTTKNNMNKYICMDYTLEKFKEKLQKKL